MKIEAGKYYLTRNGRVIGPMREIVSRIAEKWKFWAIGFNDGAPCWTDEGRWSDVEDMHEMDLISEVYVSDTPPAVKETEEELREMMRDPRYWQKREPEWVKRVTDGFRVLVGGDTPLADAPAPEAKSLRDEFAMAALQGMLASEAVFDRNMAEYAYEYADAMMEERKK
jgi:hypothetical protein